jgi:hypothetical protein
MLFYTIVVLCAISGVDSVRRVTNPGTIAALAAIEQRRQLLDSNRDSRRAAARARAESRCLLAAC